MPRIPIFRRVVHPELTRIGVPGGVADSTLLAQIADNTNRLIREKRHIPPIRQTHAGAADGLARGWTNGLETDGAELFAEVEFNDLARGQIARRELRFVSASFRRDFALTGEPDGEKLPGCYLDHVALLGDQVPAIKGLIDLAQVNFAEPVVGRAWLLPCAETESVAFFSIGLLEAPPITSADILAAARGDLAISERISAQFHAEKEKHPHMTFNAFMARY